MLKPMSLSGSGFERKIKRTRKREFLDQMERVVPWDALEALIAPHAPTPGPKGGRPPFAVQSLLRIHLLQQWSNLSDPAMEEALDDTPMFREFAGLDIGKDALPDETTTLRFRHLLEKHDLARKRLLNRVPRDKCARKGLKGRRKGPQSPPEAVQHPPWGGQVHRSYPSKLRNAAM